MIPHAIRRPTFLIAGITLCAVMTACTPETPPTVTPVPETAGGMVPGGSTSFEVTMAPPPTALPVPVTIGELETRRGDRGLYQIDVPVSWEEQRQAAPDSGGDVRMGTLFQAPDGDGLVSITQFDNGQVPTSLGSTVNIVLREVTGWMDQPGYRELNRESVVERPDTAMRVEIVYERSNGVPMHSLVLFQIDGTVFSMVNVAVEAGSYTENESRIREILQSYSVPDVPFVPTPVGGDPGAEQDQDQDQDQAQTPAADTRTITGTTNAPAGDALSTPASGSAP